MRRLLRLTLLALALAAPLAAEQWGFWDYGPGAFGDQAWKEPVADAAALPASGNEIGDVRVTLDDLAAHVWDGDSWEAWAGGGGGSGTVTSIALAVPAEWTVSGSPVTTSGTITIAEATQTANTVYAGPTTGTAAAPGFRALVSADIPSNAADTSGNAATATALAANPADCSANQFAQSIDAGGALTCAAIADADVPDGITVTLAGTATALAANGANCSAGQYPLGVDASGAVESCTADDDLPDADEVTESMLKAVDAASDEECLTYETTTGDFEWQSCGTGIGGSTGATDDAILRADGVGGATLQASAVTIADTTGDITTPGFIQVKGGATSASVRLGGSTASQPALGTHASTNTTNLHALLADASIWTGINAAGFYLDQSGMSVGNDGGKLSLNSDAGVYVLREDHATINYILSSVLVEANTAGSGSPNVLAANESGTCETNEGATAKNYQELPSAAAGYRLCFYNQDADGMRVTAATGDTIRIIDKVTAAAGYIESTTIGSMVVLVSINATEWFGGPVHGTWTDGTFTFDDTGLTTP